MSIRADKLNYAYGEGSVYEVLAVKDVSFEINSGDFVGIIGHTGSGKSTLVQLLNGLLPLKSGRLIVGEKELGSPEFTAKDLRKKVGLVFQYPEYQLFEESVELDVAFGPKNLGFEESKVEKAVSDALKSVGLDYPEIRKASPFELSGGQKRKVAIAGVIAMKPEILILDEPTSGLDPSSRDEILDLIKTSHESEGRITIIISHDMREMARLADKLIVMQGGEIAMQGSPQQIYRKRAELVGMGLDVPEISSASHALNERGFDIDTGIFDVDAWADIIAKQIADMRGQR